MLALAETPGKPIMADLAIHEFDQWSNPNDAAFSPTTICWYDLESEMVALR